MHRLCVLATALVIACVLATTALATSSRIKATKAFSKMTLTEKRHFQLRVIANDKWVLRTAKVHKPHVVRWHRAQLKWTLRELEETNEALSRTLQSSYTGDTTAWECIHSYEGSWTSNTGNGYYGGLQMDYAFMNTYGKTLLNTKGTADHWTPAEQMAVAQKAHDSGRGYYPWPNTARYCGLL